MTAIYRFIDELNDRLGRTVAWFVLGMVIVQFGLVISRYVFSVSSLYLQEAIIYMHGFVIMLGAAYTFLHNGHVRVDIFYRPMSDRAKDWTDLLGSIFFLLPICYAIWWSAWPDVSLAWKTGEGSTESSGIPLKYLLKASVLALAVLLALQGISTIIKCALRLRGVAVHDPYRNEAHD